MTKGPAGLSYVADSVHRYDRDRFLTALFAPPERREDLLALYAFNLEIAKTREAVSETMIGMMRLQWWRDALAEIYETGRPRHHAVVEALAAAIATHDLDRTAFERLIDARERDLDDLTFATLEDLEGYAAATTVPLIELGLDVLAAKTGAEGSIRAIGTGYALVGLMRALPYLLRSGRVAIPDALMQRHAVDRARLMALQPSPGLAAAVEVICARAGGHLEDARRTWQRPVGPALPILMSVPLAAGHLRQLRRSQYNPFDAGSARRPVLQPAELWLRGVFGRF